MAEAVAVIDLGSSSVKAGWAGDDVPSFIFPSVASLPYKKEVNSSEADPESPIHRGAVRDWKKLEALIHVTFERLGISIGDSVSIMITESPRTTPADRIMLADLLFTQFAVPSISIGNSASLSVFAAGRTSGVVVEIGAGLTSMVPVYEGLALAHAAISLEFGGQDISASLLKLFADRGVTMDMSVSKFLKEKMAFVTRTSTEPRSQSIQTFVLPDGTEVNVENGIFSDCTAPMFGGERGQANNGGVGTQTFEALSLCDESIRRDISQHIIIAGGTSMIPGLGDRLTNELNSRIATMCESKGQARYECRVLPSSGAREPGFTHQRKVAAWIGGSIIGSMETYRDIKLTKQEWEEGKDAAVHAKCF